MKYLIPLLLLCIYAEASIWQEPEPVFGLSITSFSITDDNQRMYGAKWNGSIQGSDICYHDWDGTQWVWGGWVTGTVNSWHLEAEPFITYEGQHLYFQRDGDGYTNRIFVADWDESGFTNERPLPSWINSTGDDRYPSVTQDGQKLYFGWSYSGSPTAIKESTWNGTDWGNPIPLPPEVNSGGGGRQGATISPDGNEIYFITGFSNTRKLAYSRKVNGVWQQWQYYEHCISDRAYDYPCLSYNDYYSQYLYFYQSNTTPSTRLRCLRSPVSVEPTSLGNIKAMYNR